MQRNEDISKLEHKNLTKFGKILVNIALKGEDFCDTIRFHMIAILLKFHKLFVAIRLSCFLKNEDHLLYS